MLHEVEGVFRRAQLNAFSPSNPDIIIIISDIGRPLSYLTILCSPPIDFTNLFSLKTHVELV